MDLLLSDGTHSTKETQFHKATFSDLSLCLEHINKFFEETPWNGTILPDQKTMVQFVVNHMLNENSFVVVSPTSFMLGTLIGSLINPNVIIAQEAVWYGRDGNAMLKAFEEWAKEKGASYVALSSIVNDREQAIRRLYRKNGYKPMETAYIKGVL